MLFLALYIWWSATEHCSLQVCSAGPKEKEHSPDSLEVAPHCILSKEVKVQNQEYPKQWEGLWWSASGICYVQAAGKEILHSI